MSDLRTRIANAIDDGHITYEQSLVMADAVIQELGLKQDVIPKCWNEKSQRVVKWRRYVTEWTADE